MMNHTSSAVEDKYHRCIVEVLSYNKETRLKAIKVLVNLLSAENNAKDYFSLCYGTDVLIKQFTCEEHRSVAQAILFALACSAEDHASNQKKLQNEVLLKYFNKILRHPRALKFPTFLNCLLLVISTLASQNSFGQYLVKKLGCFTAMISMFEDILMLANKSKCELMKQIMLSMEILCRALGTCMNNPLHAENQVEASQLFPKILLHLSSLDYNNEMDKKSIYSCLNFLMLAISGNEKNQCFFAKCGGIQYLQLLKEGYILQACLMVLNAVMVSNDQCSREASKENMMPCLLGILEKNILMDKIPLILLLCHLLQTDDVSLKCFKEYNGPILIHECIKSGLESKDLEMVVKHLLQMCLVEESKPQNGLQCSKLPDYLIGEGINFERSTAEDVSRAIKQHSISKKSKSSEHLTVMRRNNQSVSMFMNHPENISCQPFTNSNIKKPKVTNASSDEEISELNDSYILRSHIYRGNRPLSDSNSIYDKSSRFNVAQTTSDNMVQLLENSSETIENDSDASNIKPLQLSRNTLLAKEFLASNQYHRREGSVISPSPRSKSKVNKAKNLDHRNQAHIHDDKICTRKNSAIRGHNHPQSSMSRVHRKIRYSLINQAASDMSSHSSSSMHAQQSSSINSWSKMKSGSQNSKKIPSKYFCTDECINKNDDLIGSAHSKDDNNFSGVSKAPASSKHPSCHLDSTFSPTINSDFHIFKIKKNSGSFYANENKISSCASTNIQQQHLGSQQRSSNSFTRIRDAHSSPCLPGIGAKVAVSPQTGPRIRNAKTTGGSENVILEVTPPRLMNRGQISPLDLSISSILANNVDSSSSSIPNGTQGSPMSLDKCDQQLPGEDSMKDALKENFEYLHENNSMSSKSSTCIHFNTASNVKSHNSPVCSEGTITIGSTDESYLPCENDIQGTENQISKEICIITNDNPVSPKQCNILRISNSPHDTSQINCHQYPGGFRDTISAHVSPCPQKMTTKAHLKNFEIILVTPHSSGTCYFKTFTFHQTSRSQTNKLNHEVSRDSESEKSSPSISEIEKTDFKTSISENNSSPKNNKGVDETNNPKDSASNPESLDNDCICDFVSIHNALDNEGVPNVKISVNSVGSDKRLLPTAVNEKKEENQKLRSPVHKRMKRMSAVERESIKHIPLSIKEVENLQAGIKKFGLHFGMIRKSYAFLPIRTSKDLFIGWKQLHKMIGHPEEHQVNENMLEVSSDEALSSD